jgi:hypothetical protein
MLAEEPLRAKAVLNLGFCLENDMQEGANGAGRTNALLAIVLGGLVIVVAVLGLLMFNDSRGGHWHDRAFDRASVMPFH